MINNTHYPIASQRAYVVGYLFALDNLKNVPNDIKISYNPILLRFQHFICKNIGRAL